MLIDSFLFFKEFDLLEIRLKYLYDHVDQFLIIESSQSFNGQKKLFNFEKNIFRYKKYLNKIKYYKIKDFHECPSDLYKYLSRQTEKSNIYNFMNSHSHYDKSKLWWVLDSYHRECIHLALNETCQLNDYVIISDLDEIPSLNIIKKINNIDVNKFPVVCKQYEFKYYLNNLNKKNWFGSIIAPYGLIKNKSLNILRRESKNLEGFNSGGYHFTSVGGATALREKIENWSHQEFNLRLIKRNIKLNLSMGRDVFYRIGEKRNKIIDITSSKLIDKFMRNIIIDYKYLTIPKETKENLFDKIEYKYNQLIIYFIQIKNDPKKITRKVSRILFKLKTFF